jgi:hypothetical protein
LRKRFWQIGLGLLLFITTAAAMNRFEAPDRAVSRKSAGHDFLAFYAAGTFVRTGRSADLYDLPAIKAFEHEVVDREGLELKPDDFGPYWNPPIFAWVFAPLSLLSYHAAWTIWTGINLIAFASAMAILCSIVARAPRPCSSGSKKSMGEAPLPQVDWRTWALVPLLTAVSMPFIQALGHGQNTCISLLILSATVALWRKDRAIAAGAVAGLLFYKPQLGAVIAAAVVLTCGWRALGGLAITGSAMLATTLITLPGTLSDFLHRLPANVIWMQVDHRYLWDRHVTLKAFWRLLIQGFAIGDLTPLTRTLYFTSFAALAALLFVTIWKRRSDSAARDGVIAATIATMPLLMPFYFDYDLLLLSVAAALLARQQLDAATKTDRRLLAGWIALFAWMVINPGVTARTHVNGTVILLALVATMMIARLKKQASPAVATIEAQPMLRAA